MRSGVGIAMCVAWCGCSFPGVYVFVEMCVSVIGYVCLCVSVFRDGSMCVYDWECVSICAYVCL